MELQIFYLVWVFIISICLGSFLNVVILRAFSGESIVLPPSKCPKCQHKLAPWDNIPVLSYLALRGKCRYCKEKISPQYPLVELFTAILFTLIYYKFGFSLNTLFLVAASGLCIVMAVCDIREKVIFDIHAYILAALGLIYNFFNIANINHTKITFFLGGLHISIQQTFIYSILGLIAGVLIMETLARVPKLFVGKRAFGEGDSYIAGALGAFFGISNLLVILLLSLIFQVLIILPIYLTKLLKSKQYKLFIALILFMVSIFVMKLGEHYKAFDSEMFYWFTFALIVCIGFYCVRNIMANVKKNENLTYLPFGPALILAAFVVMFL